MSMCMLVYVGPVLFAWAQTACIAAVQVLEDVADDCLLRYNGPGHHDTESSGKQMGHKQ